MRLSKVDESRTKFENGHGVHFIHDPYHILDYEYLADFYAEFRKLLNNHLNLSVCGNFYRIGNTEVKCVFFLDYAYAKQKGINLESYQHTFQETFQYWVSGFNSLVQSIIFDVIHSDKHTEESRKEISERVFTHYVSGLKTRRTVYTDPEKERIRQARARRKAADAKRKAKARAKKGGSAKL